MEADEDLVGVIVIQVLSWMLAGELLSGNIEDVLPDVRVEEKC